jgi:hypothetical protein
VKAFDTVLYEAPAEHVIGVSNRSRNIPKPPIAPVHVRAGSCSP